MKQLKRQEYKKFVEAHILRPYQTSISDSIKCLNFNSQWYESIPELIEDNEEWAQMVFSRIAAIYESIDGDYFPVGRVQMSIVSMLDAHGVKVDW